MATSSSEDAMLQKTFTTIIILMLSL